MPTKLLGRELCLLVQRVFVPGPQDHALAIIADLPDEKNPDNPDWQVRRTLAWEWSKLLDEAKADLNFERVSLAWYRNSGSNNADLPSNCVLSDSNTIPANATDIGAKPTVQFSELFATHSMIMAPTELSATAPLKVAARGKSFRAATMPGFTPAMIPALKIDYTEVNRRVGLLKNLCDPAEEARIRWRTEKTRYELCLDLRYRTAHASGGLFPENGIAGNLPSGETYIVPYEGEKPGDPSRSAGELPVQIGDEVVVFEVAGNRALQVLTTGPASEAEMKLLQAEPAYANLAELGLGVLGDFGLKPVGSILLDEKLGLHIAFGRSDHFGGIVGPSDFSSPEAVIHLDRVYIPDSQPKIVVEEVCLVGSEGDRVIMRENRYTKVF